MTAQDLFGLVVRSVGLLIGIYGMYALFWGVVYSIWTHSQAGKNDVASAGQSLFIGITLTLFGLFLISKADAIVQFAY